MVLPSHCLWLLLPALGSQSLPSTVHEALKGRKDSTPAAGSQSRLPVLVSPWRLHSFILPSHQHELGTIYLPCVHSRAPNVGTCQLSHRLLEHS